jgi:transcription elongation factor Elf1
LQSFLKQFGTEAQCADALERRRWPQGFVCPDCGHAAAPVRVSTRELMQCRHCHHQTSVTAGTMFAATKLALTTWFLAMCFLTQQKNGISAL